MRFITLIIALAVFLLAACSPDNAQLVQVTALPTGQTPPTRTTLPVTLEPAQTQAQSPLAATATPLANNLMAGQAAAMALATDTAFQPTPRSEVSFNEFPVPITFDQFYDGYNMRTGLLLSDMLVSLDGQEVVMEGYMAPPLKPELDYFVLTRVRLAFCPFCSSTGDWPNDIALVYLADGTTTATTAAIRVTGRIEIGASVDAETGMVSLVRIYADSLETLQ
ncbi:MAG: hypothetical protein KME04_06895 [Pleurocapsa minor GSE-CHR-MK-17-07R]|jgi:hypothetical protein|nr:hypothetical protein [Pleurocapsa minor GSE-CHR-MK 17-07R]